MKKAVFWTSLGTVAFATMAFVRLSEHRWSGTVTKSQTTTVQLDGPATWVAFQAISTHVNDRGDVVVGRFYQSSDGSTRSETGRSLSEINIIGIKNISEAVFYLWHPSNGWESHPMDLPSAGWRPIRRKTVNATDASKDNRGFDLVKTFDHRYNVTTYTAAQLNFQPVRVDMPCPTAGATGCGLSLSQIVIGEQPRDLFKPPVGAVVEARSDPGGIVRHHR